jgi:hypothetical protein
MAEEKLTPNGEYLILVRGANSFAILRTLRQPIVPAAPRPQAEVRSPEKVQPGGLAVDPLAMDQADEEWASFSPLAGRQAASAC